MISIHSGLLKVICFFNKLIAFHYGSLLTERFAFYVAVQMLRKDYYLLSVELLYTILMHSLLINFIRLIRQFGCIKRY